MQPPIDNGTILITGTSSGIGRELARQFAPRARALVLVARRVDRLEALRTELQARNPRLQVVLAPCDVSNVASVEAMLKTVEEQVDAIDILVNNAGVGTPALFDQLDWSKIQEMLAVNVVAPTLLTRRLLPGMVARRRGGILNISSGLGLVPQAGAATYSATKHFLSEFSDALYLELAACNIVVTQVCPGPVATEFSDPARGVKVRGGLPPILRISAEQCARDTLQGFERGQPVVFPGKLYRLFMIVMLRLLPPIALPLFIRPLKRDRREQMVETTLKETTT